MVVTGTAAAMAMDALGDDFKFEVITPDNAYTHLFPEQLRWNGTLEFQFKTNGLISEGLLEDYLESIFADYEKRVDVKMQVTGSTHLSAINGCDYNRSGIVVEVMRTEQMRNLFGNFTGYAYVCHNGSEMSHGSVALNIDLITNENCWFGITKHEVGHVLTLNHSDNPDSVMYARPYKSCEYQRTLRHDDIMGLNVIYAPRPNMEAEVLPNGCIYIPSIIARGQRYWGTLCDFTVSSYGNN